MSNNKGQLLQDPFLNQLRREHVPVSIYLVNGIKLQGKGERINNKGMDLTYNTTALGAGTYTLRVYLELLKFATIENGEFSCAFA